MQEDLPLFGKGFLLQISKSCPVFRMSSRSSVLLLWLLGCRAASMKMTDSDIRSTKSRSREDMALNELQNLYAFRYKQSQERVYSMIFLFPKMQQRIWPWRREKKNRQTAVEYIDDNCAYCYRVIMQNIMWKTSVEQRKLLQKTLSENTRAASEICNLRALKLCTERL